VIGEKGSVEYDLYLNLPMLLVISVRLVVNLFFVTLENSFTKLFQSMRKWLELICEINWSSDMVCSMLQLFHYGPQFPTAPPPADRIKGNHLSMHYIHKIHSIANNMNVAMELANPTCKDNFLYVASYITNMSSKNIKLVISYTLKTTK
jgi:hypothetical protein